jgi:hypothetical protein
MVEGLLQPGLIRDAMRTSFFRCGKTVAERKPANLCPAAHNRVSGITPQPHAPHPLPVGMQLPSAKTRLPAEPFIPAALDRCCKIENKKITPPVRSHAVR